MKLDAIWRQAGRPSKENPAPVGPNLVGGRSNLELASQSPDSKTQIQRYIRLTYLIPGILELVDNSVLKEKDMLQMALRPAVELSYLAEQEQQELLCVLGQESCTPSYGQAIKIRRFSEEGKLDANVLLSIMQEEKPNQIEQPGCPKTGSPDIFHRGRPYRK